MVLAQRLEELRRHWQALDDTITAASSRAACSEVLPVAAAMCRKPLARATSMPRWIEWIQAEQE